MAGRGGQHTSCGATLTRHTFNTFATPWVAFTPHAGVPPPWVYTTVGEMCAPAFTGGSELGVNGPLMGPSPPRLSTKSCG